MKEINVDDNIVIIKNIKNGIKQAKKIIAFSLVGSPIAFEP